MIIKNIKLFLQNIHKNRILTDTILETKKYLDIIFIQELLWSTIWSISSSSSKEEEVAVGAPNHLNWIEFSRNSLNNHNYSRVILYINICLIGLYFSFHKNIFDHRDICCFSFFNKNNILFLLNIYSDSNQSALKYLKNTEANIWNILVMTGDFNIRDSDWDSNFPFHLVYSDLLINIVDMFDLFFLNPINLVPTRYSDNCNNSNSVINLMFLRPNFVELNNYSILLELWYLLDHASLVVDIHISKEFMQDERHIFIKNSKNKLRYISEFVENFKKIDISP